MRTSGELWLDELSDLGSWDTCPLSGVFWVFGEFSRLLQQIASTVQSLTHADTAEVAKQYVQFTKVFSLLLLDFLNVFDTNGATSPRAERPRLFPSWALPWDYQRLPWGQKEKLASQTNTFNNSNINLNWNYEYCQTHRSHKASLVNRQCCFQVLRCGWKKVNMSSLNLKDLNSLWLTLGLKQNISTSF